MEQLLKTILKQIEKKPFSYQTYFDLYGMSKEAMKDEKTWQLGIDYLKTLSSLCEKAIRDTKLSDDDVRDIFALHKRVCLALAPYDFDSYLLYVEWNRPPDKKFYPPRRRVLKQVVDCLQELADDKLDLLSISLPPGSGKTTLAIFFLTWLAGKIPNEPMLTGSHSNSFVRGVYDEVLRILDPNGDYLWHDVFPGLNVSNTNAKDCRIDIDKRQRFETLEFTSIGTGNAGLYRAATLLYCDDLVSGIEVALSKERLDKLWETYTTDLRQRKIGDKCKELHIATRWSVHDVIGRLETEYGDSDRAKFIVIPALDENDESNFDYAYGVGFTTKFYHEQRNIMDEASWRALYMNEPIEREGLVYSADELRRYFELPKEDPDAVRIVKHSLCDEVLTPSLRPYLIYDNCASLKDRGIDLSRKRLLVHLRKYYQQHHSNEGYILLIDYSKYYDNIRHDVFYELVEKYVSDPTALWLLRKTLDRAKVDVSYMDDDEFKNCMHTVFNSLEHAQIDKQLLTGEKFMGKHLNIGDQVAQAAGISYPILIDNYVKIVCSVPFYARYTDDSYVIDESREFLEALLKDITVIADTIGITVNLRKTRICKLSDYWRFLQVQYSLTETGRVVQKINPKRLTDMRRKMKKVAKKGVITPVAFENWYNSWFKSHYKIMSKLQRQNLDTLFNQLKEVLGNVQNHSE